MSTLQGGKFGYGFSAAGFTQAFAPAIGGLDTFEGRVIAAAIIGGTASRISGGKFANGAVTGAFSRIFNAESHERESIDESYGREYESCVKGFAGNACRLDTVYKYEKLINAGAEPVVKNTGSLSTNSDNDLNIDSLGGGVADAVLQSASFVKGVGIANTPLLGENGPATVGGGIIIRRDLAAKRVFGEYTPKYLEWRNISHSDPNKIYFLNNPDKCCG